MEPELTPGAGRVFDEAARWSISGGAEELTAPALLMGLLAESECRAALVLAGHGIGVENVRARWPGLGRVETVPCRLRWSAEVEASLAAASQRLQDCCRPLVLATEHLLLGLASAEHETAAWLRESGLDADALQREIYAQYGSQPGPLPLESTHLDLPEPVEPRPPSSPPRRSSGPHVPLPEPADPARGGQAGVLRVLDAAANRCREGLRVVEDYVRFLLDDRHLTGLAKRLRHDLGEALAAVSVAGRLCARETRADVGTAISTPSELARGDPGDVLIANFIRVQESLRTLEEFGKIVDPTMAAAIEQIRYRSYTLQRAVEITRSGLARLERTRLYVLVDGRDSEDAFCDLVQRLVDGGADAVQLRDKQLDDRRLLDRARLLREIAHRGDVLVIINDRPDLAALAGADGVHVGQEELSVKDARTIVGTKAVIGVSTHSIEQARQAVLDGADYIGVGPTFFSGTKQFESFPGLGLLRAVAAEIRLPAFAIGGITADNVGDVLGTGFGRVAVSGAVTAADDPREAAKALKAALGPSFC